MPILTELHLYPIKSCAGISLREATLTAFGLRSGQISDREWMVVDADGRFLTQREHPAMARIVPRITHETLDVQAPGMTALRLPLDAVAWGAPGTVVEIWDEKLSAHDCGAAAAAWFSTVLGKSCRLVRFSPQVRRLANPVWTHGTQVPTRFADGYPLLVISEASLDDLNQKLQACGRAALPMNRFRPNIVLGETGAFDEDYAATISVGDIACVKPVKPCPRCPIPSIDQVSGEIGPDPLDILRTYRVDARLQGAITFGMNAMVIAGDGAMLTVGQPVELEIAF